MLVTWHCRNVFYRY